jgi:predicted protein tyrosine phosphatase
MPSRDASRVSDPIHVLFVCRRNQWRSPTAEQVWRRHPRVHARSAGTSPNARHAVLADDAAWADVIFAMEEKHKSRLIAEYRQVIGNKPLHVLDIPDEYRYTDPALVQQIETSVAAILDL